MSVASPQAVLPGQVLDVDIRQPPVDGRERLLESQQIQPRRRSGSGSNLLETSSKLAKATLSAPRCWRSATAPIFNLARGGHTPNQSQLATGKDKSQKH